jgi:hypothetical protein
MDTHIVLTVEERKALTKVIQTVDDKKEYDCFDIWNLPEPVKMDYYVYQNDPVTWMNMRNGKYFFDYWKQEVETPTSFAGGRQEDAKRVLQNPEPNPRPSKKQKVCCWVI